MDYKEKYELARDWYNDQSTTKKEKVLLETLFPELKESEDEKIRKALIHALKNLDKDHCDIIYLDGFSIQQCIDWLEKQGKQKPYPETLDKAIELYYYSYGNGKGGFDNLSLEKFKDIIKTFVEDYGNKTAWSDEDYNMIYCCTSAIWAADYYSHEDKEKMENWLESLKPQPQWKPTEEQLHCFKCVIDFYKTKVDDTIVQSLLDSLYNDLKKL